MIKYKKGIRSWPENERPRERALRFGFSALSNAELLALVIGQGTKNKTAVDLGKELMKKFRNLKTLSESSIQELMEIEGIKEAKALSIGAVFELARRLALSRDTNHVILDSPSAVSAYYTPKLAHLKQEEFHVAMLNTSNALIRDTTVTKGILDATLVHPREVFREALKFPVASIILVHNHPGGNPEPSTEDIRITERLVEAGKILGIDVLDHVIVSSRGYVSLKEMGVL